MDKRTQAIRICELLENHRWIPTSKLLTLLGVPRSQRPQVLMTLNALKDVGVLDRIGRGKYRWNLERADWDRSNPFRTGQDAGEIIIKEPNDDGVIDPAPAGDLSHLIGGLVERINNLSQQVANLAEQVEEAKAAAKATSKVIQIPHYDGKVVELEGVTLPAYFDQVKDLAVCRRNILLVGPAGCGKTYLSKLVAAALNLPFGSISCTAGMSEAHLLGRSIPDISTGESKFQTTDFLQCYEHGGVFLMDELDAADPNLLLTINSAIANGYCPVPNRSEKPHAERHPDFVMIASANTYGRGANRVYAGRNQLDEATLDRFRIGTVECYYDEAVERSLCPADDIRLPLQRIRKGIEQAGLRRIMSTRFIEDAYILHKCAGWQLSQIKETFFLGWSPEERQRVESLAA